MGQRLQRSSLKGVLHQCVYTYIRTVCIFASSVLISFALNAYSIAVGQTVGQPAERTISAREFSAKVASKPSSNGSAKVANHPSVAKFQGRIFRISAPIARQEPSSSTQDELLPTPRALGQPKPNPSDFLEDIQSPASANSDSTTQKLKELREPKSEAIQPEPIRPSPLSGDDFYGTLEAPPKATEPPKTLGTPKTNELPKKEELNLTPEKASPPVSNPQDDFYGVLETPKETLPKETMPSETLPVPERSGANAQDDSSKAGPSPSDKPVEPELDKVEQKPSEGNGSDDNEEGKEQGLEPSADELLLEEREKSSTPYPKPDFTTPSEKVVPLPIKPAPEDFPGFEKKSTDDPTLPEPRRLFPLPKVQRIPPPPNSSSPIPQGDSNPSENSFLNPSYNADGNQSYPTPDPMASPWMGGTYSNSREFGPLLKSGMPRMQTGAIRERHSVFGPASYADCVVEPCVPTIQPIPQSTESWRERLNDKRWELGLRHQLPVMQASEPKMGEEFCQVPYQSMDFAPIPFQSKPLDPQLEIETYTGKLAVETQRPWVEWWRPFYTGGMYDPGVPVFSDVNLLTPSFLVYGDYRTGVGVHRNNGQDVRSWAHRLNLDMDMRFTGTERFHLFTGPLDHNGRFTRLDFSNNPVTFEEELDAQIDTAFFEGDLGAITGSWLGDDAPFDLPFTCGLIPLLYQNGIWMEDAVAGFAFGAPWRHNRALNISNYDATFFAGFNQVTSPAFQNDNNAASVFGTAWFLEAYNGYIEADYAYLNDLDNADRSYHNAAIAYTRRYFGRISNSVRLIGNAGQSGPANTRSADGGLLIVESSLVSSQPSHVVPYWNFFVGSGRPQSVARAANAGGILRNTGINFETDALTGYPTLNANGANSYGGAVGINVMSADFRKQWIGEFAALDTFGDPLLSGIAGPQYALGTRYQTALSNSTIWRMDFMNGWFDNAPDIFGTRTEFRWKF